MGRDGPRRGDLPPPEPEPRGSTPGRQSAEEAWGHAAPDLSPLRPSESDDPKLSSDGEWVSDVPSADTDPALSRPEFRLAPLAETFDAGDDDSGDDGPDRDEAPGILSVATRPARATPPPGIRREVASDPVGRSADRGVSHDAGIPGGGRSAEVNAATGNNLRVPELPAGPTDAAGDQVNEPGPEFAEPGAPPMSETIEFLIAAATALRGAADLLNPAALAEVTAAQAAGHAVSIDIRMVRDLRPGLERALAQLTAMQESAGAGALPGQGETAELAVRLTAAGKTAEQVQGEIPDSSRWQSITRGIKRAVRATAQLLTAVAKSVEVVRVAAGINIFVFHVDVELARKSAPQEPHAGPGGASPGR
jgi:hypothetical protein